jgi:hypothetical protein
MIIYFPPSGWKDAYKGGTSFYKSKSSSLKKKWSNFSNRTLSSDNEINNFYKDHRCFFHSDYKRNRLVGFLKSQNFHHSVPTIKSKKNIFRTSFNINFNLVDIKEHIPEKII